MLSGKYHETINKKFRRFPNKVYSIHTINYYIYTKENKVTRDQMKLTQNNLLSSIHFCKEKRSLNASNTFYWPLNLFGFWHVRNLFLNLALNIYNMYQLIMPQCVNYKAVGRIRYGVTLLFVFSFTFMNNWRIILI